MKFFYYQIVQKKTNKKTKKKLEKFDNLIFDVSEKVLKGTQDLAKHRVPKKAKDIINESLVQSYVFIMFISFTFTKLAVTQAFELPAIKNIMRGRKAKKTNITTFWTQLRCHGKLPKQKIRSPDNAFQIYYAATFEEPLDCTG